MKKSIQSITIIILFAFLILFHLSCAGPGPYPADPQITIHAPNEATFYVPSAVEPLVILISFPDGLTSAIFDIELLDSEGSVVFRRGGPPVTGPSVSIGAVSGQKHTLSPPVITEPGWYTVKVYGDTIWGESEPFRLSHIGPAMDDHAITVNFLVETTFHPGGTIHLNWHAWGDYCDPTRGYTIWLFHNGSHGPSHTHWILEDHAMGSDGDFTIPADVPSDGSHFFRVDNGPRCDGTSAIVPID